MAFLSCRFWSLPLPALVFSLRFEPLSLTSEADLKIVAIVFDEPIGVSLLGRGAAIGAKQSFI